MPPTECLPAIKPASGPLGKMQGFPAPPETGVSLGYTRARRLIRPSLVSHAGLYSNYETD